MSGLSPFKAARGCNTSEGDTHCISCSGIRAASQSFEKLQRDQPGPTPDASTSIATGRIRAQIHELLASEGDLGEVLEQMAHLGARMLLQTVIGGE